MPGFLLPVFLLFCAITTAFSQSKSLTITEDLVNLRQEPSTDSQLVEQLPRGKKCVRLKQSPFFETIGNQTDFWYEVIADEQHGWVFGAQTDIRLSDTPAKHTLVFKRALRDAKGFHLIFESPKLEHQGWKGYGTGIWDFGYGDGQNNYKGLKFFSGGKKLGDVSNASMQGKPYIVEWKVAPMASSDGRVLNDKEVPVIVSIEKPKPVKAKPQSGEGKDPKPKEELKKDPKN